MVFVAGQVPLVKVLKDLRSLRVNTAKRQKNKNKKSCKGLVNSIVTFWECRGWFLFLLYLRRLIATSFRVSYVHEDSHGVPLALLWQVAVLGCGGGPWMVAPSLIL